MPILFSFIEFGSNSTILAFVLSYFLVSHFFFPFPVICILPNHHACIWNCEDIDMPFLEELSRFKF